MRKPIAAEVDIIHDCVIVDVTERLKEGSVKMVSNWIAGNHLYAVLEIDSSQPERYIQAFKKHKLVHGLTTVFRGKGSATVIIELDYGKTVTEALAKSRCVLLEPTVTTAEFGDRVVFLAPGDKNLKLFFDALEDDFQFRLRSKRYLGKGDLVNFDFFRTTGFLKFRNIFEQLTPAQREAFELACKEGYYRVPKRITLGEIAVRAGLSEPTFREHLRKAEQKLLPVLEEVLRLF